MKINSIFQPINLRRLQHVLRTAQTKRLLPNGHLNHFRQGSAPELDRTVLLDGEIAIERLTSATQVRISGCGLFDETAGVRTDANGIFTLDGGVFKLGPFGLWFEADTWRLDVMGGGNVYAGHGGDDSSPLTVTHWTAVHPSYHPLPVIDGAVFILITGAGHAPANDVYAYDPATDLWTSGNRALQFEPGPNLWLFSQAGEGVIYTGHGGNASSPATANRWTPAHASYRPAPAVAATYGAPTGLRVGDGLTVGGHTFATISHT